MAQATSLAEIAERIKKMKFKKRLFGGVDEADVWKQIKQLDADYRNMFKIQNQIFKMELVRVKASLSGKQTQGAKAKEAAAAAQSSKPAAQPKKS